VVAVNGDASVERIKGDPPFQNEVVRASILASLRPVDLVVVFQEDTPVRLIKSIRPDLLIKGGNYRPEQVVGHEVVEAAGGKVTLVAVGEPGNSEIRRLTKGLI
jgi:D-beta-D-heptose 7-phosphate kinase/D-beta-D-heptose 1-phosphate adenosyltransferase